MRRIAFLAVAVLGVTVFAADVSRNPVPNQAAIKKAVLKVHNAMAKAERELDAEAFFSHILDFDNGLIMQDGVVFNTKQEALAAVRTGFQSVSEMKRVYEQTEVTTLSPEAALVTSKGTSEVTLDDGRTFRNPFAASTLFVLRNGQWKLLHGHYSLPNPR